MAGAIPPIFKPFKLIKMKVKKVTEDAVLIEDKGMNIWVDVWVQDGELTADWNQYIFFLKNPDDVKKRDYQNNDDNFIECTSLAIQAYCETFKIEL